MTEAVRNTAYCTPGREFDHIISRDALLAAVRECVTVVKPGEVLLVRAPDAWTPRNVMELQEGVDAVVSYRDLGISVLILPGAEFAVAAKAASEALAPFSSLGATICPVPAEHGTGCMCGVHRTGTCSPSYHEPNCGCPAAP